jgi:hypothetical protein
LKITCYGERKEVMIFLLIPFYIFIAVYEIPALLKKGNHRELISFWSILIIAFIFNLLLVLGVKVPSPFKFVQYIIEDVLKIKLS